MRRRLLAVVCVLAATGSAPHAQSTDLLFADAGQSSSPRIAGLEKAAGSGNGGPAVAAFWNDIGRTGTPLIERVPGEPNHSWLTFLWRATSATTNVVVIDGVAAGVGGGDPKRSSMRRVGGTDVWYRTYKVRNDAAFTYMLSPNDSLEWLLGPRRSTPVADPLNPNLSGSQSFVRLPSAPRPIEGARTSPVPAGTVASLSIMSAILRNTRALQVYTPPGFTTANADADARYPLLVVLDSGVYGDYVPVPAILDVLIAQRRIPPLVAVMVGNVNRAQELPCFPPFADFLASELVPWMRATFRAGAAADRTIVSGASLGGLAASFAGFQHPEVFGNVLSQSGSYWWAPAQEPEPEWLTRRFAAVSRRDIRLSMSVGAMEVSQQLDTNRRLRDVLEAHGYDVDYTEFNGNHSYLNWRAEFGDRLARLLGPQR